MLTDDFPRRCKPFFASFELANYPPWPKMARRLPGPPSLSINPKTDVFSSQPPSG